MIRLVVTVSFVILMYQSLVAQPGARLNVPASPAFGILNYEPAAVMRPSNARDLAADVLNSFDKSGKLLLNLGLELSPYWLVSHPALTRSTYLNPDAGQTFLQSFSLSAATVKDSVSGSNKLGAGFRFKLLNGKPLDKKLKAVSDELKARNTILDMINGARVMAGSEITTRQQAIAVVAENLQAAGIDSTVIENFKKAAETAQDDFSDSAAGIRSFLDKLISDRRNAESALVKQKSDLLYDRRGLVLEFAGATGFNASEKNNLERIGFWANASYYTSPDNIFTLTARCMNSNNDSAVLNVDAGLGFLQKTAAYNISVEGMIRWYRAELPDRISPSDTRVEKDLTFRFAVQGSYMISKDVSINLNLGKDFNAPFITSSGFFSILGVNYSIISKKPGELK